MRRFPVRIGAALAALAVSLAITGCLHYQVQIDVGGDGAVVVRELVVPDPAWRQEAGDSSGGTANLLSQYASEVATRGGEAMRYGLDSATAVFRYPSLSAFARDWPDTTDNRSLWDRSLYRRARYDSRICEELVLFRMSPPDPTKALPNQRYPVLSFVLTLPVAAETTNAHSRRGTSYAWRFSQNMTAIDSVWLAWPTAGTE